MQLKKKFYIFAHLLFMLPAAVLAQSINYGEYFIGNDPGLGNGTSFAITTPGDSVLQNVIVSTVGLTQGAHTVCVRTRNTAGRWSHQICRTFFVRNPESVPQQIVAAEYFFDTDPGVGNGTPVTISIPSDSVELTISTIINPFSSGSHYLVIRTQDAGGHWSHQLAHSYLAQPDVGISEVNAEEELEVYPNPSSGSIFLVANIETNHTLDIELCSMQSKLVKSWTVSPGQQTELVLENVPAGVYYIKCESGNRVAVRKITVKR